MGGGVFVLHDQYAGFRRLLFLIFVCFVYMSLGHVIIVHRQRAKFRFLNVFHSCLRLGSVRFSECPTDLSYPPPPTGAKNRRKATLKIRKKKKLRFTPIILFHYIQSLYICQCSFDCRLICGACFFLFFMQNK